MRTFFDLLFPAHEKYFGQSKGILLRALLGLALASPVSVKASQMKFENTDYDKIVLEVDRGDVKFNGIESGKTTIDLKKPPEGTVFSASILSRVLRIKGKSADDSRTDITLALPKDKAIESSLGHGETSVDGLDGARVKASIGRGKFVMQNSTLQELDFRAGKAEVEVNGLLKSSSLDLGSGTVSLTCDKKVKSILKVRIGSGSLSVWLPEGSSIDFGSAAKFGTPHNFQSDFPSTGDGADVSLEYGMGSGTLSIKKLKNS